MKLGRNALLKILNVTVSNLMNKSYYKSTILLYCVIYQTAAVFIWKQLLIKNCADYLFIFSLN